MTDETCVVCGKIYLDCPCRHDRAGWNKLQAFAAKGKLFDALPAVDSFVRNKSEPRRRLRVVRHVAAFELDNVPGAFWTTGEWETRYTPEQRDESPQGFVGISKQIIEAGKELKAIRNSEPLPPSPPEPDVYDRTADKIASVLGQRSDEIPVIANLLREALPPQAPQPADIIHYRCWVEGSTVKLQFTGELPGWVERGDWRWNASNGLWLSSQGCPGIDLQLSNVFLPGRDTYQDKIVVVQICDFPPSAEYLARRVREALDECNRVHAKGGA